MVDTPLLATPTAIDMIGAWYQNKVKRDGNIKSKAIIAIMRKLVLAL